MADIESEKETDFSRIPSEVAVGGIEASKESLMPAVAFSIVLLFALIIAAGLVLILS